MASYYVSSGQVSSGIILNNDGMVVYYSGTANSTTVNSGGRLYVSSGGTANETTVNSGGSMYVYDGGTANSTTVNSGGFMTVEGMTIGMVSTLANAVTVNPGGSMYVSSGGTASIAFNPWAGGSVTAELGALVNYQSRDAGVYYGGRHQGVVSKTDAVAGVQITSGCSLLVYGGGTADRAAVDNAGELHVYSGGTVTGTTIKQGGRLFVDCDALASDTVVSSGGFAYVLTKGKAETADIRNGGVLYVGMGGSAENITIQGSVHAATGADLKNVSIEEGGTLYLYGGAILDGVINVNGTVIIDDPVHNYGQLNFQVGGASSDTAMLNDYSLLNGKDLSITVDPAQYGSGSYVIAGGAASFSDAVAVYGTDGAELCTLSAGASEKCGDYRYTLSVENDELIFSYQDEAVIRMTEGDLNMDGRADIIMTIDQSGHPADGSTGAWLIQENQTAAWGDLSTRTSGWEIFGTGWTFADKATNDVYVRSSDNVIGAWTTGDDGKVTGWETVGEFSADTQIVGLGDFNGNGQTDLLLRNNNGAVGCFFTSEEKHGWNYFQSIGDEWKLSAVGDMNGDGRDDVVLKHDAGFAGCWLTQEDGTMAWADLDTLPDGYEIVGAGDFNGDSTDDVLLKSGSYYGVWLVNNGNAAGWMGLGDLGDVTVEQIADFNGDGVDDLRIRTSAGDIGAQLVMAEDTLDWHYYGAVGAEWKTGLAALS